MKSKLTIVVVVAMVLGVLYVGDRNNWFRPVKAQTTPAPYLDCEKLKNRGDEGAKACYQKLAQSRDAWAKAEGLWGLGDLYGANDAFRAAIDQVKNDPARRVRWGRLFVATDQAGEANNLYDEALKMSPDYVP